MQEITEQNHLDIISFTNVDREDFEGIYGGNPTVTKAGETRQFPRFLAQHYTKHLIDKILLREFHDNGDELKRQKLEAQILGSAIAPEAVAPMPPEASKTAEFTEVPKDEAKIAADSTLQDETKEAVKEAVEVKEAVNTDDATGFKCETCGKATTSRIGLAGHKRSHKK